MPPSKTLDNLCDPSSQTCKVSREFGLHRERRQVRVIGLTSRAPTLPLGFDGQVGIGVRDRVPEAGEYVGVGVHRTHALERSCKTLAIICGLLVRASAAPAEAEEAKKLDPFLPTARFRREQAQEPWVKPMLDHLLREEVLLATLGISTVCIEAVLSDADFRPEPHEAN